VREIIHHFEADVRIYSRDNLHGKTSKVVAETSQPIRNHYFLVGQGPEKPVSRRIH